MGVSKFYWSRNRNLTVQQKRAVRSEKDKRQKVLVDKPFKCAGNIIKMNNFQNALTMQRAQAPPPAEEDMLDQFYCSVNGGLNIEQNKAIGSDGAQKDVETNNLQNVLTMQRAQAPPPAEADMLDQFYCSGNGGLNIEQNKAIGSERAYKRKVSIENPFKCAPKDAETNNFQNALIMQWAQALLPTEADMLRQFYYSGPLAEANALHEFCLNYYKATPMISYRNFGIGNMVSAVVSLPNGKKIYTGPCRNKFEATADAAKMALTYIRLNVKGAKYVSIQNHSNIVVPHELNVVNVGATPQIGLKPFYRPFIRYPPFYKSMPKLQHPAPVLPPFNASCHDVLMFRHPPIIRCTRTPLANFQQPPPILRSASLQRNPASIHYTRKPVLGFRNPPSCSPACYIVPVLKHHPPPIHSTRKPVFGFRNPPSYYPAYYDVPPPPIHSTRVPVPNLQQPPPILRSSNPASVLRNPATTHYTRKAVLDFPNPAPFYNPACYDVPVLRHHPPPIHSTRVPVPNLQQPAPAIHRQPPFNSKWKLKL